MRILQFRSSGLVILALLILSSASLRAQLPTVGTHFTFGVIEGPDKASVVNHIATDLWLYVVNASPNTGGCGVIASPSGYVQTFTFDSSHATKVKLDHRLMHLDDMGKTKKGLIVTTSEPVSLVLHDYAISAGDATQIFPDAALDTSYVVASWGLFNDQTDFENNRVEFLVTAKDDSTIVTIVPSVTTLLGEPLGVPIHVTLNAGECYMLKADTTSKPLRSSLGGSTVVSSKPVSVITGITCAYVPTNIQSCNEVMDELLGKKWWGNHFLVQPLGNLDSTIALLATGDRDFLTIINGHAQASLNSRMQTFFAGTAEIFTTAKVEMHQFTRGNWDAFNGISDPTMVTVLDTSLYFDTVRWYTPDMQFRNWVPVIFPSGYEDRILLDGRALTTYGPSNVIPGSAKSVSNPSLQPGLHSITSPVPIFALVTGFESADAYSFLPGGEMARQPKGVAHHTLLTKLEPAMACANFGVTFSLDSAITFSENASGFSFLLTYDPNVLKLVALEPHAVLLGASVTADSSIPGKLLIQVTGKPILAGSDLFRVVFDGRTAAASTTLTPTFLLSACSDRDESLAVPSVSFAVAESNLTLTRSAVLSASSAVSCQPVTLTLTTDALVNTSDRLSPISIEVVFDTAEQTLQSSTPGALLKNLPHSETGAAKGDYVYVVTNPSLVSGSDSLLSLTVIPHVAKPQVTVTVRVAFLLCTDTVVKDLTITYPVARQIDSSKTILRIVTAPVSYGDQASADVILSGLPISANVAQFDLLVSYNHNVLSYAKTDLTGTLASGWNVAPPVALTATTDRITFTSNGASLGSAGTLAHLLFSSYVSDSASTELGVSSSLESDGLCPLTYAAPKVVTQFLGKDLCGDSLLRTVLRKEPLSFEGIDRAPSAGIVIQVISGRAATANIEVVNMLGELVYKGRVLLTLGKNVLPIGDLNVSSGQYIARIESLGAVVSSKFTLTR